MKSYEKAIEKASKAMFKFCNLQAAKAEQSCGSVLDMFDKCVVATAAMNNLLAVMYEKDIDEVQDDMLACAKRMNETGESCEILKKIGLCHD